MIINNINKLRFFLIILVVLIHSHNIGLIHADDSSASVCYAVFDYIMTQGITKIAVPGLFMISGYLFCLNMREWNTETYVSKLRRRIRSIFVPYIIWNILKLATLLIQECIAHGANSMPRVFSEYNGWHLLWDGGMPFHSPVLIFTWYLRDLMVFQLFVPCLYCLIQKTHLLPYLLLALCHTFGFWPTDHVCVAYNLAFFTLGMTGALLTGNIQVSSKKTEMAISLLAVAGGIALLLNDEDWVSFITTPFIITVLYMHIHKIPLPQKSIEASMFIYLAHGLLFHSLCKRMVCQILPFEGTLFSIVRLLTIPVLTITLLTILYATLSKYAKRLLQVLTGNR